MATYRLVFVVRGPEPILDCQVFMAVNDNGAKRQASILARDRGVKRGRLEYHIDSVGDRPESWGPIGRVNAAR